MKIKFQIADECDDRSQGKIKGKSIDSKLIFADGSGSVKGRCPYCINKCVVKVTAK